MAVAEGIKTTRSTVDTIKHDESIALAKAELTRAKHEIKSSINSRNGAGGNGITIE